MTTHPHFKPLNLATFSIDKVGKETVNHCKPRGMLDRHDAMQFHSLRLGWDIQRKAAYTFKSRLNRNINKAIKDIEKPKVYPLFGQSLINANKASDWQKIMVLVNELKSGINSLLSIKAI
jgi:hypothetical protein